MGIYRETKSVDTIAFRFCWTIIRTVRGFISDVKCRWMDKKGKNIYKNLEKLYNKKSWLFDQWISVRFFKIRHVTLETFCRIHVPLVHRKISNHSSFSTKFKSYKSCCQFFFTNCQITIHYFLSYIYIYIYMDWLSSLYIYIYIYGNAIYVFIYMGVCNVLYIHVCGGVVCGDSMFFIYIYIYIYIYANFIKHNRTFMFTYFLLDPFEFPYYFYRIRVGLIYVFFIVVYIPSTFCPTLGHHQGRIYYKSDVTFLLVASIEENKTAIER